MHFVKPREHRIAGVERGPPGDDAFVHAIDTAEHVGHCVERRTAGEDLAMQPVDAAERGTGGVDRGASGQDRIVQALDPAHGGRGGLKTPAAREDRLVQVVDASKRGHNLIEAGRTCLDVTVDQIDPPESRSRAIGLGGLSSKPLLQSLVAGDCLLGSLKARLLRLKPGHQARARGHTIARGVERIDSRHQPIHLPFKRHDLLACRPHEEDVGKHEGNARGHHRHSRNPNPGTTAAVLLHRKCHCETPCDRE